MFLPNVQVSYSFNTVCKKKKNIIENKSESE